MSRMKAGNIGQDRRARRKEIARLLQASGQSRAAARGTVFQPARTVAETRRARLIRLGTERRRREHEVEDAAATA